MEAPLTEQNVRRILRAAFQGESAGSFRMRLALKEMEKVQAEWFEEMAAELERHYEGEMTGE